MTTRIKAVKINFATKQSKDEPVRSRFSTSFITDCTGDTEPVPISHQSFNFDVYNDFNTSDDIFERISEQGVYDFPDLSLNHVEAERPTENTEILAIGQFDMSKTDILDDTVHGSLDEIDDGGIKYTMNELQLIGVYWECAKFNTIGNVPQECEVVVSKLIRTLCDSVYKLVNEQYLHRHFQALLSIMVWIEKNVPSSQYFLFSQNQRDDTYEYKFFYESIPAQSLTVQSRFHTFVFYMIPIWNLQVWTKYPGLDVRMLLNTHRTITDEVSRLDENCPIFFKYYQSCRQNNSRIQLNNEQFERLQTYLTLLNSQIFESLRTNYQEVAKDQTFCYLYETVATWASNSIGFEYEMVEYESQSVCKCKFIIHKDHLNQENQPESSTTIESPGTGDERDSRSNNTNVSLVGDKDIDVHTSQHYSPRQGSLRNCKTYGSGAYEISLNIFESKYFTILKYLILLTNTLLYTNVFGELDTFDPTTDLFELFKRICNDLIK
jgi:hypothetical protein